MKLNSGIHERRLRVSEINKYLVIKRYGNRRMVYKEVKTIKEAIEIAQGLACTTYIGRGCPLEMEVANVVYFKKSHVSERKGKKNESI